jgi:hypothetical protein
MRNNLLPNRKKIKKRVCIVGAGYMATEYLKVLLDLKKKYHLEISGIFSRTYSKAYKLKQKYNIVSCYNDLDCMMHNVRPTHVILAVSEINTYNVCKILSKYKLQLLIEKPCGYNYEQSKKINKLFRDNNDIYLALNRRYFNSTIKSKQILKKRGKLEITILDQQIPNKKRPIKIQKNWMYANSIHLLDYIFNFCKGKIIKIVSNKSIKGVKSKTIFFSSGDIANYRALWNMPGPWGVFINTKDIYIKLMPLENLEYRTQKKKKLKFGSIKVHDETNFKPGLKYLTTLFISQKTKNLCSLKYNLKLMKLIKRVYSK